MFLDSTFPPLDYTVYRSNSALLLDSVLKRVPPAYYPASLADSRYNRRPRACFP